ncbi:MAG: PrsW family intramembrane metalloprotease [Candidatus Geothermarchaeales archaeon]
MVERRERILRTLSQLEGAYRGGRIAEEAYRRRRSEYLKELGDISAQIPIVTIRPEVEMPGASRPVPTYYYRADAGRVREIESELIGGEALPSVIYSDPPPLPWQRAWPYLLGAVMLVGLSFLLIWASLGHVTMWIERWQLLTFSAVGPAIFLHWMYRNDKFEREPLYYLLIIFGWGTFAGVLSLEGNSVLAGFLALRYPEETVLFLGAVVIAPFVEEAAKAVGVYYMAKHPEFNDSMDGLVYGFASGMGFAFAENFFYIVLKYGGNLFLGALRVFLFGLGHGLWTAMAGRALGAAKVRRGYVRPSDLMPGLSLAIFGHGLYNSFLIGYFLPIPEFIVPILWPLMVHGLFTSILFNFVRKAWAQERLWRYDRGLAPVGRRA